MAIDQVGVKIKFTKEGTGAEDAKSSLSSFGDSLNRIKEIAAGVGLERLTEKIVELGKEAAAFAIDTAGSFERTGTAMATILGGTQKAGNLLKELSDWEVHTPFDFQTITDAANQMLAFGAKQADILPHLKEFADISMGDPARLKEITSIWGEVNSLQEVNGRTILRLSSIGIPIFEALSEAIKKTGGASDTTAEQIRKMMTKGEIKPAMFDEALQIMTEKGGMFFDQTIKQSQTWQGLLSSIHSQFQRIALEIMGVDIGTDSIKKGGIFDVLKGGAADFLDFLSSNKGNIASAFTGMGEAVKFVMNIMVDLATTVKSDFAPVFRDLISLYSQNRAAINGFVETLGGTLYTGLKIVIGALAIVTDLFGKLALKIMSGGPIAAIGLFTAGFVALNIVMAANPIGLVVAAFALLSLGIYEVATKTDLLKTRQDIITQSHKNLSTAIDGQKRAEQDLKDAIKGVSDSEFNLEGAQLRLKHAQDNLITATQTYGKDSLEAKDARHELKGAENDVRDAMDQVNKKMDEAKQKHDEAIKKSKDVVKAQDDVTEANKRQKTAWDDIVTAIQGALNWFDQWNDKAAKAKGVPQGLHLGTKALGGFGSGSTLVGENGPEIVDLPSGSYVHNNNDTRNMMDNSSKITIINNNTFNTPGSGQQLLANLNFQLSTLR